MFNTSPRQQYRDCVMGLGVSAYSNVFINYASCIPSLSCLFIPSLYDSFFKFAGLLIYLSPLILYTTTYYLCDRGQAPIWKLIIEYNQCLLSSWIWCNTYAYQVSSPCVEPLASLRSEEIKDICCCGCHGNDLIHMCTKRHLQVCYS